MAVGYMDKERAETQRRHHESERTHHEHLQWFKGAQAESGRHHYRFMATNHEYAKTLGKFDDYRDEIRRMKW